MKGQVIGKNMTHGYAGDYARQPDMIVDTHPLGGSTAVKFGTPLVYDNNSNVVSFGASGTAVDFVGIASREFKSLPGNTSRMRLSVCLNAAVLMYCVM